MNHSNASLQQLTPLSSYTPPLYRRSIDGEEPTVLADIYQDDTNIVIWRRSLDKALAQATEQTLKSKPSLQASLSTTPQEAYSAIYKVLGATPAAAILSGDMAQLVDMFCCLFDLKAAGLRVSALDRAMCPRFHVDRVPCRLVTTYQGCATQWLPHNLVDRSKLGPTYQGKPDHQSGLYKDPSNIQQLQQGDVALLKGELWENNENAGLVHRSPQPAPHTRRLLLTLDFSDA